MLLRERTGALLALVLAASAGCRLGYQELGAGEGGGGAGGSAGSSAPNGGTGDIGPAGDGGGGTDASGGTAATDSGGSSTGGTSGGRGGSGTGGTGGKATGGASGASGASGAGGSAGMGGAGGGAGSGGCSPTNGGVEICDGVDNDCAGGADDGVTCPSTCRGIAFGGNGYMLCDGVAEYPTADMACTMLGMHLVKVSSEAENTFIFDTMFQTSTDFIWLGGDDIAEDGSWRWKDDELFWTGVDTGSAPAGVYTNWYPGYPRGGSNLACLEMRDDGTWDDKQCTQGKRYVCELLY